MGLNSCYAVIMPFWLEHDPVMYEIVRQTTPPPQSFAAWLDRFSGFALFVVFPS